MQKKIIAPVFAAILLFSNGITAFAAPEVINAGGVNTVFDAEYYAAANPDVAAEIGTGRDALIQHYTTFGKTENRQAYAPDTDVDALLAAASSTPAASVQKKKIKTKTQTKDTGSKTIYEYRENGSLLTETYYANDGRITYRRTYDEHDSLLSEASVDEQSNTSASSTYAYTYDSAGNILTKNFYGKDGATSVSTYTYDGHGNPLTEVCIASRDGIVIRNEAINCTYTYDEYGNILTISRDYERTLEFDYAYTSTYAYTYDERGNLLTTTGDGPYDGGLAIVYTYDEYGNRLTMNHSTSDTYPGYSVIYTYDSEGNMLTENYSGGSSYTYSYTYY